MNTNIPNIENGYYMAWMTECALKREYAEEPQNERVIHIMETKLDAYTSILDIMGLTPGYEEYKAAKARNV